MATEGCIAIIDNLDHPQPLPLKLPSDEQDKVHDIAAQSLSELLPHLRRLGECSRGTRYPFAGGEESLLLIHGVGRIIMASW